MVSPFLPKVVVVKGESHEINIFSSLANHNSLQNGQSKSATRVEGEIDLFVTGLLDLQIKASGYRVPS